MKLKTGLLLLISTVMITSFILFMLFISNKTGQVVEIDFTKKIGAVKMEYGANEDNNWLGFVSSQKAQEYHKDVNSRYIRVWVSSQWYRQSTIPLQDTQTYDFTNLDSFINAVLDIDAVPFILFVHESGVYEEGHSQDPPENYLAFADYVEKVVQHYDELCAKFQLIKRCNVNDWYFEIWNEPYTNIWWKGSDPAYTGLFNIVYQRIKSIAPNAKVGGYSAGYLKKYEVDRLKKFLQNANADFISIHPYGNSISEYGSERQKMSVIKKLYYDSMIELDSLIKKYSSNPKAEIINTEYSSDYTAEYMPHLDEPFTAAWYASALIWQIKSEKIPIEMFYSGTSNGLDNGFGMWSSNMKPWPVYYMKQSFVKYNKYGSDIFSTKSSKWIDVLAVENEGGKFITIVNKHDKATIATIKITSSSFNQLKRLDNNRTLPFLNNIVQINLEPYEVIFMEAG